jgi:hypothetical protein
MLNILKTPQTGNPAPLFSDAHVSEARRAAAWLENRIKTGKTEVVSELVELTPVLAELLLQRNPGNRSVRQRAIDAYKTDIINGDWAINGESIKVSSDGLLNDGQHRCRAVIGAGRPIKTMILFGVGRETRMTVDQGAVRTAGNFLAMSGKENANQIAAVASLLWQYEHFGITGNNSKLAPTKVQVAQIAALHPDIDGSVKAIPSHTKVGRSRSVMAFCHYLVSRRARTYADSFFLRLCLGDGLSRRDPIYHCRERLLTDRRMTSAEKIELILRTWNAHRKGNQTTKCSPILGELPSIER